MSRNHTRSDSSSFCVVCCDNIEYFAIGQCDHPICYVCSVRMRVLGNEKYCAVCRTDLEKVLFTRKCGKWSSLKDQVKHGYTEKDAGICYVDKEIRNKVNELLQHKCPKCLDQPPEKTFNKLRDHLKREHQLFFCDICHRHLQKFTHEMKVYSRADLAKHRRLGDSDDKAYKGHPLCQFCDERFLDDEDLHRHLRKNHFWCHICEKDGKQLYFTDYANLRAHFKGEHYLCEEDMCKYEQYTSVFRSDIDLQAHIASKHSQKMTKAQVRQARQLEVDLVFNPRNTAQGRNITGRDYGEVQAMEQRFRRNRGKGRNALNNREEDQNVQAAIEMSLAKTEENNQSSQQKTGRENPRDEDTHIELPEQDFPLLNGAVSDTKNPQSSSPKVSPKPVKKMEAFSQKAKGVHSLEDFPTLGKPVKGQQNGITKITQSGSSQSPQKSVRKTDKKVRRFNSLEDFPSLEAGSASMPQKNVASNVGKAPQAASQGSPKPTQRPESTPIKNKAMESPEDFPTLLKQKTQQNGKTSDKESSGQALAKPLHKPEVLNKKSKTTTDSIDDFPSLGTLTKTNLHCPPPGFSSALTKKPEASSSVSCPPGFQLHLSSQSLEQKSNTCEQNTSDSCQSSGKTGDATLPKGEPKIMTNNEKKEKITKSNQSRNQNLIENIKALLEYDMEKFKEFKTLSGNFRQGECSADAYYGDCMNLFGMNFALIFNELVTLLPDQEKQKELLRIHNDEKILARQSGKQQSTGKKLNARNSAWGSHQNNSAPVNTEGWQKTRSEADFPSLPSVAPRQIKPARIYRPSNMTLKSAWVRGK